MPAARKKSEYAAALAGLLLCLGAAYLLFHSLAGGTLLTPNVYDSYTLQAVNWLAGRNYIAGGEHYTWLELAIYNGRYYQSFPPVPGVFLVPWVLALGENVPANLVIALYGLLTAAGVFACFWRQGASPAYAAFFGVFVTFGSNFFWLSTSGGVWFMAQVLGLCLCVWGIYFALAGRYALPSLLLGLAVGCRPFYALLAALWLGGVMLRAVRGRLPRRVLVPALLPISAAAIAMAWYNFARFGSFTEFGHNYLPEFVEAANGQFSPAYLIENLLKLLRPVTLDIALQLQFPLFDGFLAPVANPLFALWAGAALAAVWRHKNVAPTMPEPPVNARVFPHSGGVLAGCFALLVAATCLHRTLGGWQFGARYLVDLQIWPLLWFLARPEICRRPAARPNAVALTLCGLAVLFNLYGAVFMLTA